MMAQFAKHNYGKSSIKLVTLLACACATVAVTLPLTAAVLPEDQFDALLHHYEGGGISIEGPSILLRKQVSSNTSVSANYYVDAISSASIDVITSASPYSEERTEHSIHVNYLHDKSILSAGYINSEENDFEAQSVYFNVSQDMFGDLTTLSMGYAKGQDDVFRTVKLNGVSQRDSTFSDEADRQNFKIGLSQILTKDLITSINYELITDKGYLNNPYRLVRFTGGGSAEENYPKTRSSNAASLSAKYYLPYRAALQGTIRLFSDTWGIKAHNYELGYTHPIEQNWVFGGFFRKYSQSQADFYRDLFDPFTTYTYMARDKELSTYDSWALGLEASYELRTSNWSFIDKGSFNLKYTRLNFDYENFSNLYEVSQPTGNEASYGFYATVIQAYLSISY